MVRSISILFVTVLAAIFLFPSNGKTIVGKTKEFPAFEPVKKQNQSKYLLVQISRPTKGKPRQLAASLAQAGIGIGQAIFCKGARRGPAAAQAQAPAAAQAQAPAAAQAQAPAAAQAQGRHLEMLGTIGKALFC